MVSDNKTRSEVILTEVVVNLGVEPLLKVLKYVEFNHLHPPLHPASNIHDL
jgi:hypothetical protein